MPWNRDPSDASPKDPAHRRDGFAWYLTPLVFAKFRELRSAKAVMRYLRGSNLRLPERPLLGSAPHDVVWRAADSARVVQILENPAYAGAYVYGRRRPHPLRRQPGSERIGTVAVAPEGRSARRRERSRSMLKLSDSSWRR